MADTCFRENFQDDAIYCNASWDSVSCWPATRAGVEAVIACPNLTGVDPSKNATKLCHLNATWAMRANYNDCLLPIKEDEDLPTDIIDRVIYNIGFVLSTITLVAALFIFLYFRSLRCLKNFIHSHLIVTFILRNTVWIVMQHSLTAITESKNTWACQILVSIFNYAQVTNFSWMLVEGLYLHIIVVWTYTADRIRKRYFLLIGWVFPLVIVISWIIVRSHVHTENRSTGYKQILIECWLPADELAPELYGPDFIYIVPILLVLAINIIFLGSIIWVLVTKLRATNSWETQQLRKAIKATLLLFPLLGITYVIFITTPNDERNVIRAHKIVNAFLQSFQGFFVTLFYCFLNEEVKFAIRKRVSFWRDHPRYSRSSMGWTNDSVLRKESISAPNGKINHSGRLKFNANELNTEIALSEKCEHENML